MEANGIRVLSPGTENQHRAKRSMADSSGSSKAAASGQWGRAGRPARRPAPTNGEPGGETVLIELSEAQVDQVVRTAGQAGTMSVLLSRLRDPQWTLALDREERAYPVQLDDKRLSRSLLLGLLVLSCFPHDGGHLGVAELARKLDMNTSTTHRYVATLMAVGLLERDPVTRRYRLASQ
jgi:DNA-binding MarR family transcriptional regulator